MAKPFKLRYVNEIAGTFVLAFVLLDPEPLNRILVCAGPEYGPPGFECGGRGA